MNSKIELEFEIPETQREFSLYRLSEEELTSEDRPVAKYRINTATAKQIVTVFTKDWHQAINMQKYLAGKFRVWTVEGTTSMIGDDVAFSAIEETEVKIEKIEIKPL